MYTFFCMFVSTVSLNKIIPVFNDFQNKSISIVIYHLGIEHWIAWLNVSLVHYKTCLY